MSLLIGVMRALLAPRTPAPVPVMPDYIGPWAQQSYRIPIT